MTPFQICICENKKFHPKDMRNFVHRLCYIAERGRGWCVD